MRSSARVEWNYSKQTRRKYVGISLYELTTIWNYTELNLNEVKLRLF